MGPAPAVWPTGPLAYVQWYTPLKPAAHADHNMYDIRPQLRSDGSPAGTIISLSDIRQSCMLTPAYGRKCDSTWTKDNVLDKASSFYVNNWSSLYAYKTLW